MGRNKHTVRIELARGGVTLVLRVDLSDKQHEQLRTLDTLTLLVGGHGERPKALRLCWMPVRAAEG